PPTCHIEESEGSGTSGTRSTSSDSTAPLLPGHLLTHTTPSLVPILHRTEHMAVRVPPTMSPGLSAGMSELILGTDSKEDKEVEESLDSNSESKGTKDEGHTTEDEVPAAGEEGLAAGVEGPGMDDEIRGLDDKSHGVEIDGLGLEEEEEEEAVCGGQQHAALFVGTVDKVLVLHQSLRAQRGCRRLGCPHLPRGQTQRTRSGSHPISPSPFVVPLLVSSPMIPLTVPSPISSPLATSTATIPVDEDQFIETALQRELQEMRGRVTALEDEKDRKER
nr:hypothetical protein [Tanacetum cinerariifolium]